MDHGAFSQALAAACQVSLDREIQMKARSAAMLIVPKQRKQALDKYLCHRPPPHNSYFRGRNGHDAEPISGSLGSSGQNEPISAEPI